MVESKLGKGTRICVSFVLQTASSGQSSDKEGISDNIEVKEHLSGSVLLVEDNAINTEIAIRILESFGLNIEHAENGQQAADLFAASDIGKFRVILMDIQMPVLNGYGATEEIRALDRPDAKTVPIIAMTADAFEESVTKAMESGMNDYITKPIDIKKLYEVLNKHEFCGQ